MQKDNNAKKGLFFWIRSSAWKRTGTVFFGEKKTYIYLSILIQTVASLAEIFNHFTIYHEDIPDVSLIATKH